MSLTNSTYLGISETGGASARRAAADRERATLAFHSRYEAAIALSGRPRPEAGRTRDRYRSLTFDQLNDRDGDVAATDGSFNDERPGSRIEVRARHEHG